MTRAERLQILGLEAVEQARREALEAAPPPPELIPTLRRIFGNPASYINDRIPETAELPSAA